MRPLAKCTWRKQSSDDYQGVPFQADTAMSPIIADGLCVVHVGGKTNGAMFAFEMANGELKWKWDGDGPAASSPVVMTSQGTKQLVTLTAKSVVCLGLSDGKLRWRIPFEAAQGNNTTPVIDGQTIIYSGQGKGMFALKLEPQGDGFATVPIWTNSQLGARFTTPVFKDGRLFGYHNHFFCADAKTGATLWEDATNRGNSAAVVDADQVILATTVNSELVGLQAEREGIHRSLRGLRWRIPRLGHTRLFATTESTCGTARILPCGRSSDGGCGGGSDSLAPSTDSFPWVSGSYILPTRSFALWEST